VVEPPRASIVIPTYNHREQLKGCLDSIVKLTDLSRTDVWVMANGCKDDTDKVVSSMGAPFHLLSCPEPLGFTKAANIGMAASSGERIILLNDDTAILDFTPKDSWIRMLEEPFSDPAMAATGAIRDVWSKGRYFLVFFCVMLRRDVVLEMGLLDEAFNPGAGEDTDFCLKVQSRGYKIRQVPNEHDEWHTEFPIWHVGGMTSHSVPNWGEVTRRNLGLLESRYPRTDEDRKLQSDFSRGRQNVHKWGKK